MSVYATTDGPLIVTSDESTATKLKEALSRLIGGVAVLAGGSLLVQHALTRWLVPTATDDGGSQPASDGGSQPTGNGGRKTARAAGISESPTLTELRGPVAAMRERPVRRSIAATRRSRTRPTAVWRRRSRCSKPCRPDCSSSSAGSSSCSRWYFTGTGTARRTETPAVRSVLLIYPEQGSDVSLQTDHPACCGALCRRGAT